MWNFKRILRCGRFQNIFCKILTNFGFNSCKINFILNLYSKISYFFFSNVIKVVILFHILQIVLDSGLNVFYEIFIFFYQNAYFFLQIIKTWIKLCNAILLVGSKAKLIFFMISTIRMGSSFIHPWSMNIII